MPELPEVEAYRILAIGALHREIATVNAPDRWFLKGGIDPGMLEDTLIGERFVDARRIGKLLLLPVEDGPVLGIRFGMTGSLVVDGTSGVDGLLYTPRRREPAWDRFGIGFADGGSLVVSDPRRLGGIALDPVTTGLGPDAAGLTLAELTGALDGSKAPLKARLLDQSRISGVGNLMADEVLWRSGLSPQRAAGSLSTKELRSLHGSVGAVITDLLARGGSHRGDLMEERHVGGRCPKDGTELVRATVGGRTSWWCPRHQH